MRFAGIASIDRSAVRDRAEVARRLGLSRARVTQLMDLTLLAPDIQERIFFTESVAGLEPISERSLRAVVNTVDWAKQRVVSPQIDRPRVCGCCLPAS